jgi:L-amino acid N-acyltransferase YncA
MPDCKRGIMPGNGNLPSLTCRKERNDAPCRNRSDSALSQVQTDAVIRAAMPRHIPAITDIYAHHVLHGLASFETEPPDAREMARRYREVRSQHLPYLVAELDGRMVGYAYATEYRARAAYRYTVEDSVYIDDQFLGRGIGSALLSALIAGCQQAGCRQMIAVIGYSANWPSIRLHEKCGFAHVGMLPAAGWKFSRWVDSVLMQRGLGPGSTAPPV